MKRISIVLMALVALGAPVFAGDTMVDRPDGSRVHIITNELGSTATIYDKNGKMLTIRKHPDFAGTAAHFRLIDQYRAPPSRSDLPVPLPGRGAPTKAKQKPSVGATPIEIP